MLITPLKKYEPPTDPLVILYRDDTVLVADKPSGLLTVPGKDPDRADCLWTRIQAIYPETRLVHRLDMPTSGLVVFAMDKDSQRHLSRQFEQRRIGKRYQALAAGSMSDTEGYIDLPLICDWPNRPRQIVSFKHGKSAQTRYRVIERSADTSRVDLFPKTGRSHQLRVHLQALGHPIIGDPFYNRHPAPRMMLHAADLSFRHPGTQEDLSFSSPVPF